MDLVVFSLEGEDFGVPIEQVWEINRLVPITSLPKAPPGLLGVINLRGKVIPVVSLRERFGLPKDAGRDTARIVVSEVAGGTVGFVVDAVKEVLELDESTVEPAPEAWRGLDASFIKGIGKAGNRLIILLDLARVFDFSQLAGERLDRRAKEALR